MTASRAKRHYAFSLITVALLPLISACTERPANSGQGGGAGGAGGAATAAGAAELASPDVRAISGPAPDSFRVAFETSKGRFEVAVYRAWAPLGADRFYHLARLGFLNETRFFRVLPGFMAQFGMHGTPAVNSAWEKLAIQDDPPKESNARGTVTFAATGQPNSRTTQLFINFVDNKPLDGMGFRPVGRVVDGMAVVDSLYGGYGEGAPNGIGPSQEKMALEGNAYLAREFPKLDYIKSATIVGGPAR